MTPVLRFRLWLWRLAWLASAITALFFAWMAVAPFSTDGEPVFGAITARAQRWEGFAFAYVQIFGVALWALAALTAGAWGRGFKALLAGVLLLACFIAMASEYVSLIQDGALRDPVLVAAHKLMVSRAITLGLALCSLGFGWWARPRR